MAPGATDFGLFFAGGPGSFVGGELSTTFSYRTGREDLSLGLTPFVSYNQAWSRQAQTQPRFAGALAVIHFERFLGGSELTGGMGEVWVPDGRRYAVPLLGVRVGH